MWSTEELEFILYNNRSVKGVVTNFLPNINPLEIIDIENKLDTIKSNYKDNRCVIIDKKYLNLNSNDLDITPDDLNSLLPIIEENIGHFNENEYEYLNDRGLGDKAIYDLKLLGLSSIKDEKHLEIIGASIHPLLKGFLSDGVANGGIIIPLISNGKLVNCSIRKLNTNIDFMSDKIDGVDNYQTLKYSLACPDVSIWGLDAIDNNSDIWIAEGIFDMYALNRMGKTAVSSSSAMWSSLQLHQILSKTPNHIYIFSDNDITGLRSASYLKDFFTLYNIETTTMISNCAKDPAEHYFQKIKDGSDLVEIEITPDMIQRDNNDIDIVSYLSKRRF